jgi:syntaxin 7
MSFQDVCHDLEAGHPLPPRPPPPPPPRAVVAHCVFQINTKVSELRRLAHELGAAGLGGNGDARVVRERIRRARADVTRLARNTARRLADPAAAAAVGPNLAADFQAALREFQWVQDRIIEADRQETAAAAAAARLAPPLMFPPPSPPSYGSPIRSSQLNNANTNATAGAADQQCNIQMQQQQQLVESRRTQELALLDNEIAFNEALVEERGREICKIQQEIAEINEIFVELAKLVHDQQWNIDVVGSNVEKAAMETSKAEEKLSKAALTHETNSSMNCLLITVFGLVMLIFALVFVA